jgi:hypothetical protein
LPASIESVEVGFHFALLFLWAGWFYREGKIRQGDLLIAAGFGAGIVIAAKSYLLDKNFYRLRRGW